MGLFSSLKKLFTRKEVKGKKVETIIQPKPVITNLGVGYDDKDTSILVDTGIQTTFNTDSIEELVEGGEVENVSN